MSQKLIGAQKPFTVLVGIVRGSSDPSKGPSGNPVVMRSTYKSQTFVEIGGRGPETNPRYSSTPGAAPRSGLLTFTVPGVPVRGSGTLTVADNVFTGPTAIRLGQYLLTSGEDFTPAADTQSTATLTVVATPSTATLTIGGVVLTAVAGARTSGSNNYDGSLGSTHLIAVEISEAINDAANGFSDIASANTPGAAVITLTAVTLKGTAGDAITLTTSDALDVSRTVFGGGVDNTAGTATAIGAAIDMLPEYSATVIGSVVTVEGPTGPLGNQVSFYSEGFNPANFTFSTDGHLEGAEPRMGPAVIG